MLTRRLRISLPTLFALIAFAIWATPALAQKVESTMLRVEINAGKHDRINTPTTIALPKGTDTGEQIDMFLVQGAGGIGVPVQALGGKPPRVMTMVNLKAGETRAYDLRILRGKSLAGKSRSDAAVRAMKKDAHLEMMVGAKPVLRYNHGVVQPPQDANKLYARSGFIHPVRSPDGVVVTNVFPEKHLHHYGIWFPWRDAKFEGQKLNFWETKAGLGTIRFAEYSGHGSGRVFGHFRAEQAHVVLKAPGGEKTALDEMWDVRVYNSADPYVFDFESTQACATDKPFTVLKKYYGGLGVRGSGQWEGEHVTFLTSTGKGREDGNFTAANWCAMYGKVDGKTAGMAILCHPGNFRAPQPMRLHPKEPFFCYAPGQNEPFTIKPGKPYVSRYRFVVFDGQADKTLLDRLWRDYADPPTAKVSAVPTASK